MWLLFFADETAERVPVDNTYQPRFNIHINLRAGGHAESLPAGANEV